MGPTVTIATTISTTIVSATAATSSSVFFLPSTSYLDGPVLSLAIIVLGLVLHNVTLTKHIAIGNSADVAEEVFAAV
jgi:hypothetical protein